MTRIKIITQHFRVFVVFFRQKIRDVFTFIIAKGHREKQCIQNKIQSYTICNTNAHWTNIRKMLYAWIGHATDSFHHFYRFDVICLCFDFKSILLFVIHIMTFILFFDMVTLKWYRDHWPPLQIQLRNGRIRIRILYIINNRQSRAIVFIFDC